MSETIITKRCSKCKETKPLSEFNPRCDRPCGYQSQCKECRKIYRKSTAYQNALNKYRQSEKGKQHRRKYQKSKKYKEWLSKYRKSIRHVEYVQKYLQSIDGKASRRRTARNYRKNHPERAHAHDAVKYAVKTGKLLSPKKFVCIYCWCEKPTIATEYHHWLGYQKQDQLNVIPVCRICHKFIHSNDQ